MILKDKKILIMGIRNKWSIAYGAAKSASEQGAKLYFTFMGEDNRAKVEELISEFEGAKAYECDVSIDSEVEKLFKNIKSDVGELDGIVHCIAHAFTDDLHNDFIETSKEGFSHANDVSAYTMVSIARYAREKYLYSKDGEIIIKID